jgi:hypothetical protein
MNAEIEHASEHGKAAGEKRPGQRKAIGPRAAREHREKARLGAAASPRPMLLPPRRRTSPSAALARTGVVLGGLVTALFGRRVRE